MPGASGRIARPEEVAKDTVRAVPPVVSSLYHAEPARDFRAQPGYQTTKSCVLQPLYKRHDRILAGPRSTASLGMPECFIR